MTILLNEDSEEPLYIQLYCHIKHDIQAGHLRSGTRLPSIRNVAKYLNISKNTVETAYQQLVAEGYVESRARSGLYVVDLDTNILLPPINSNASQPLAKHKQRYHKPLQDEIRVSFSNDASPAQPLQFENNAPRIDFRQGNVDLEHFPFKVWRRLTLQSLNPDNPSPFRYGERQGELSLREQIATYLHHSRGVNCSPQQIIIGSGIQQLLILLCQLIGVNKQPIAFEDPGYDGARLVFEQLGYGVKPISLEEDGLNVTHLKTSGAKIVYITPSHQFPCGMIMPYSKRLSLLKWAEEEDGLIIEDDYDGEFRYTGRPIPALQGLDTKGRVVYVGTFSKSMVPSIRMSYMVLPERLLNRFENNFSAYEQPVSKFHQHTMQLFMANGYWERHIRKMRNVYDKKRTALLNAIETYIKEEQQQTDSRVHVEGTDSGLHIILHVNNGMNETELINKALSVSVKVYPTSRFWYKSCLQSHSSILLGFGGLSVIEIDEGIKRLRQAWFD